MLCQSVLVCFEFIMAVRFSYHENYPEMHCDYFGWSYPIWSIAIKVILMDLFQ